MFSYLSQYLSTHLIKQAGESIDTLSLYNLIDSHTNSNLSTYKISILFSLTHKENNLNNYTFLITLTSNTP